ncbi:MAG: hypothetical protein H7Y30_10225 [Pyrinomonadaceae bacterium]|nr:hypothetical protein [Pyrinomonadaceae bacterium]
MSEDAALIGDSSMHDSDEAAPGGGFYRHRLTIRFTSGETLLYTVREALHAEDIPVNVRFVVINSYLCDKPEECTEIVLLNLNDVSYIKTEHVTEEELQREATTKREAELRSNTISPPPRLTRIGFI